MAACTGQRSSLRCSAWSALRSGSTPIPPYVGYFASRNGGPFGSDFSVFIGLVVGGIVYYVLARTSVRAEGEATAAAASEARL